MLCKSWRALETTEWGDIITQELLTIYPCCTDLPPPLMMQCVTVPHKRPTLYGEAWDSMPSIQSWTLLLWSAALSLSSSICPLSFFWNTSFSDCYAGVLLYSRLLKVGGTRPGICPPFLGYTPSMEISLRPKALNTVPRQGSPNLHLSLNFSPESRHLTAEAPIWHLFMALYPKLEMVQTELLISKPLLTVLPISGIASLPTQLLKLKPLSHPWFLFSILPPTADSSANLSALLSQI